MRSAARRVMVRASARVYRWWYRTDAAYVLRQRRAARDAWLASAHPAVVVMRGMRTAVVVLASVLLVGAMMAGDMW